jgi:hypothetical protein
VSPLPPARGPAKKTPVVIVTAAGERAAIPLTEIAARADATGEWSRRVGGADFRFHYRPDPPTVAVEGADPTVPFGVVYAFWFAWHAQHPGDGLLPDSVQREE